VTVSEALTAAQGAHDREVLALRAALWMLAESEDAVAVASRRVHKDATSHQKWVADLREGHRLARLLARDAEWSFRGVPSGDLVEAIRDAVA